MTHEEKVSFIVGLKAQETNVLSTLDELIGRADIDQRYLSYARTNFKLFIEHFTMAVEIGA